MQKTSRLKPARLDSEPVLECEFDVIFVLKIHDATLTTFPLKALGFCWQDRWERKDTVPSSMKRSDAKGLIKRHECKK